jgi:hypothetical protein
VHEETVAVRALGGEPAVIGRGGERAFGGTGAVAGESHGVIKIINNDAANSIMESDEKDSRC